MGEVILSINFKEIIDDYQAQNDLRKQLGEGIKKAFDKELESQIIEAVKDSLKIDTKYVSELIKDSFEETFNSKLVKRIDDYMLKLIEKESDLTRKLIDDLRMHNSKFLQMMSNNASLDNIHFEFISLEKNKGRIEERVASYYLKKEECENCVIFDSWSINKFSDYTIQTLLRNLLAEKRNGKPDLVCKIGSNVFFIEVKSFNDGIHKDQIIWAKNHPYCKIIYLFVDDLVQEEVY